jgi:hypothetical protein
LTLRIASLGVDLIFRIHATLELLECRFKIFGTPDFKDGSIEALGARCRMNFGHVHHVSWVANVPHDRQSAHVKHIHQQVNVTEGGQAVVAGDTVTRGQGERRRGMIEK